MMNTKSECECSTSSIVENKPLSPGNVPGLQHHQLEYPTPGSVLTQSMLSVIKQEPFEHGDNISVSGVTWSELPTIQLGNYVPCASVKLESISNQDMNISAKQEDLKKTLFVSNVNADSRPHPVAIFQRLSNPKKKVTSGKNGNMDVEQLDIPTEDQKSTVNSSISVERNHDVVQHTNKTYTCSFCDYSSSRKVEVTRHMRTHTGEKPCSMCDYKSTYQSVHDKHMRTHTGEKPYSCLMCDYKSAHHSARDRHMRTHTGEKPYSCSFCDYSSSRKGDVTRHMRTHSGEKPYSCSMCDYKSTPRSVRDRHMRTHAGEKPYLCLICNYRAADKFGLIQHMRTHTGEKPYSCSMCNCKFTQESARDRHMRTHTGEKPYVCSLCDYKFTNSDNLQIHLRKHTGEKPYLCSICNHRSAAQCNLTRHMRTHTGEKKHMPVNCAIANLGSKATCPYICELTLEKSHMHRKYTQKPNLFAHMRTRTEERTYVCVLCDRKYTQNRDLHIHMRNHRAERS